MALGGCGSDDKKDAQDAFREFVAATNRHDARKLCDDLLTKQFIEQTTGATGGNARDSCKQQYRFLRPVKLGLSAIKDTKIHGDNATLAVTLRVQDETQDRVVRLRKEHGRWRLAGGPGQ
jgi:hypothetical protein